MFAIAFDLTVKETTKHHLKGVSVLLPVASREAMATARRKATTLVLCSAAAMERCGNEGLSQQLLVARFIVLVLCGKTQPGKVLSGIDCHKRRVW